MGTRGCVEKTCKDDVERWCGRTKYEAVQKWEEDGAAYMGRVQTAMKTPVQGSAGMYHSWASFIDGRVHEAAAGREEQGRVIAREPALWQPSAAASAAAIASWPSAMHAVVTHTLMSSAASGPLPPARLLLLLPPPS